MRNSLGERFPRVIDPRRSKLPPVVLVDLQRFPFAMNQQQKLPVLPHHRQELLHPVQLKLLKRHEEPVDELVHDRVLVVVQLLKVLLPGSRVSRHQKVLPHIALIEEEVRNVRHRVNVDLLVKVKLLPLVIELEHVRKRVLVHRFVVHLVGDRDKQRLRDHERFNVYRVVTRQFVDRVKVIPGPPVQRAHVRHALVQVRVRVRQVDVIAVRPHVHRVLVRLAKLLHDLGRPVLLNLEDRRPVVDRSMVQRRILVASVVVIVHNSHEAQRGVRDAVHIPGQDRGVLL
uniref:(northern house mosquito) hypothetical protein n=1 Tax=Culex pipiens TaxID=7175 RepID=A0A8D8H8M5_CULPI